MAAVVDLASLQGNVVPLFPSLVLSISTAFPGWHLIAGEKNLLATGGAPIQRLPIKASAHPLALAVITSSSQPLHTEAVVLL